MCIVYYHTILQIFLKINEVVMMIVMMMACVMIFRFEKRCFEFEFSTGKVQNENASLVAKEVEQLEETICFV